MDSEAQDGVSSLIRRLQEKHSRLTDYREAVSWRLFQGESSEVYRKEFDDSLWEPIELPAVIDVRRGGAWLRTRIAVPQEIGRIGVSGSTLKMSSQPVMDKVEVFVDSEKIFSADYWADFRSHKIALSEDARPQMIYTVAVHIFPKYEPVALAPFRVAYSNIEKTAFEIDSFIQELRFAKALDEELAQKVSREFDLKAFAEHPSVLVGEIEKARVKLSILCEKAQEFKVHLVAHAHIDMNWLWHWQDTVNTIEETFGTVARLMTEYPDFHFSQSQAVTYKVVEERFPDIFEAVRRFVRKGRWDVTASMWVEADLNMAGTEALVRQFLEARRYVKDRFGFEPRVCWEPDTFGHIWTMPQILKKSGCDYYYFMRCGKGHPIFWWKGPDGSRVLAFTSVYNNFVTPENVVDSALDLFLRYGLKTSMFVYGVGDHGGGATVEDIEAAHNLQKKRALPRVLFSSTHRFFEEVEKEIGNADLPVVDDELQFIFDGCYTTHTDIKRHNRMCERLLVDAEKFSVFCGDYPREALRRAWLNTLFNQFHDILDGSGTSEAYIYPLELAEEALQVADQALKASLGRLAGKIKLSKSGVAIVVFNSLPWDRDDVVKVEVPSNLVPTNPTVVSADDERVPVQVSGDEVLFVAKVPSMGYRTFYLIEGDGSTSGSSTLTGGENILENDRLRIEVDKQSGTMESLYDKIAARFVFKKDRYPYTKPVFSNLLQVLHELPHPMSAWIIGDISRTKNLVKDVKVELSETGPVKATMKVVHRYHKSKISQHIFLYKDLPRIDIQAVIDWRETSDDKTEAPMLKVSYTPILGRSKAAFEIPFGYVERVEDGTEVPALRWVDLSDGEYGVSLLNDSKHGFDVKGNTIRMTLVRTSYSPDPRPDQRTHKILYSLYPHRGSWKEALAFRKGYEINHPLEAFVVTDPSVSGGSEPEVKSFVRIRPENVVVSCLKLAENSDDCILRMYDATGEGAEAELVFSFKVKEASETDLMERSIANLKPEGNKLRVTVSPFEIKTIRIKRI